MFWEAHRGKIVHLSARDRKTQPGLTQEVEDSREKSLIEKRI